MRLLDVSGVTIAASLLFATAVAIPSAKAGRYDEGPILGYVTVDSIRHPGTVTGPIRQGPVGLQVRLPGGTWLYCGRTCGDTLRDNTLDFWDQFRGGDSR